MLIFLINCNLVSRNEVKAPYTTSKVYSKDKIVEGELFGKRVSVRPDGNINLLSVSLYYFQVKILL